MEYDEQRKQKFNFHIKIYKWTKAYRKNKHDWNNKKNRYAKLKIMLLSILGKGLGKLVLSFTAGGNIHWYNLVWGKFDYTYGQPYECLYIFSQKFSHKDACCHVVDCSGKYWNKCNINRKKSLTEFWYSCTMECCTATKMMLKNHFY